MDKYLYWLDNVGGIGARGKERLLEAFGTGEGVYRAGEKHLTLLLEKPRLEKLLESRKTWDVDQEYALLRQKQISFVCTVEPEYPDKLRHIPDHPFSVYYRGRLPSPPSWLWPWWGPGSARIMGILSPLSWARSWGSQAYR